MLGRQVCQNRGDLPGGCWGTGGGIQRPQPWVANPRTRSSRELPEGVHGEETGSDRQGRGARRAWDEEGPRLKGRARRVEGVGVARGGPRSHTREPQHRRRATFWAKGTRSRNGGEGGPPPCHAACRKNLALRWRRFLCVGSQPAYVHTDVLYTVWLNWRRCFRQGCREAALPGESQG